MDINPPCGKEPFTVGFESNDGTLQIFENVYGFAYCDDWIVLKLKDSHCWVDAENVKDIRLNLKMY